MRYQNEVKSKYETLLDSHVDNSVEAEWNIMKTSMVEALEEIVPIRARQAIQPWMTEEILGMMDERQQQTKNGDRYLQLDSEVKMRCKERKEEWLNQRCLEVERLEHTNTRVMHEKIK